MVVRVSSGLGSGLGGPKGWGTVGVRFMIGIRWSFGDWS